jgi:hypothetical protein
MSHVPSLSFKISAMAIQYAKFGKVKMESLFEDEEKQLCKSMFHISWDPIIKNGKKNQAF